MDSLVAILTVLCSTAICARLLTFKRPPGTRRRLLVGMCAWLLIVCTGGLALRIAFAGGDARACIWQLGILLILAVLSFRSHGNVASMLRVPQ